MKGERELERIYRAAASELRNRVFALDPLEITTVEADRLRLFARQVVRVLDAGVAEWAMTYLRESYRIGERKARVALEILGRKPVRPAIDDPVVGVIDRTIADLMSANASMPRVVDQYLDLALLARRTASQADVQEIIKKSVTAQAIEDAAKEAIAKGQSRSWLQAKIREILKHLISEDGFIVINNRTYKATYYARMVAGVSLRKAQTEATKDSCRRYDNDLVEWSDHGTTCPATDPDENCETYEGKVYSISGTSSRFPQLTHEPPLHPNCEHSILPTSEEAIDIRERFEGRGR